MMSDDTRPQNELQPQIGKRLGRLPRKSTRKALLFSDFFPYVSLPKATNHWTKRPPIPQRTFANDRYGDCTIAKQAVAAMRMERVEQKRTIEIADEEVVRVYLAMTTRFYGGGDTGAYEVDALANWRDPETTFHGFDGHRYTIDAYLAINPANHQELRAGIALASARGIAICWNLPKAFAAIVPPAPWDVPKGQPLTGDWMPGSWGGHSSWSHDFVPEGILIDHTWDLPPQLVTWEACAAYLDEAHLIIDSVDTWRKHAPRKVRSGLDDVVEVVNEISQIPIQMERKKR